MKIKAKLKESSHNKIYINSDVSKHKYRKRTK